MKLSTGAVAVATSLITLINAQQAVNSTFEPARPPAIPLAVKSPYLSTWQMAGSIGGNGGYLPGEWPTFWAGQIVGWTGLVRVDNLTYTWMGAPNVSGVVYPLVNQTAFTYTSTRSTFVFDVAGMIKMTVEFLSNVTPTDMKRQSFPISFMNVEVQSTDLAPHKVDVYTDISAEWISGDRSAIAQWNYGVIQQNTTGGVTSSSEAALRNRDTTPMAYGQAIESDTTSVVASSTQAAPDNENTTTMSSAQPREYGTSDGVVGSAQAALYKAVTTEASSSQHRVYGTQQAFEVPTTIVHPSQAPPKTSNYIMQQDYISPSRTATTAALFESPTPSPAGGIAYHQIYRQTQLLFSEIADQTEYGNWYYLTDNSANLTHQSGTDNDVRAAFNANGYLANTEDTNYRAINDSYPVYAFAICFSDVTTPVNQTWAVALAQEQAVQFEGYQGNVSIPSLWTEYFTNDLDALSFYFGDYATTSELATALDNQIATDSSAASGANYTLLTSLAVRQAFGGLEFTNTTENPLAFLKEISSDGNVNTVDVIFPFHPIAIYLNANILRMLLDPLFINQESGHWPFQYSIHDIGSAFPNATGHDDGMDEMQPLEECGDMILMTLAYAQRTKDVAYLNQHYDILRQWNDFLVNDSLVPANQISTDDFAGALPNQTNLAVKGIIGIEAMAQIANLTGHFDDGANYTNIAHDYITQWQTLAVDTTAQPPHTTLNYGNTSTYSLLYNIFADRELGLNLVPQSIYDMQSAFYPTRFNTYGVPLDTRHNYTKSDWSMFCASVASPDTREDFIDHLAGWTSATTTSGPQTDLFETINGSYPFNLTFIARPVVGGRFALLALNSAPTGDGFVGNGTAATAGTS